MPYCYILHSSSIDTYYIGACQGELETRLLAHNEKKYGNKAYTSRAHDWEVYLSIETDDFAHAIRIERKIKVMKSRKYIKNLKQYSELRAKIWRETRLT